MNETHLLRSLNDASGVFLKNSFEPIRYTEMYRKIETNENRILTMPMIILNGFIDSKSLFYSQINENYDYTVLILISYEIV